jgi:Family of unknown function (DUF6492)
VLEQTSSPDWAFITPSYSGDFERCKMLCQSMDVFLSGKWHHYIVVDKPDEALFKPFKSEHRTILLTHDVAPPSMHHLFNIPFAKGRSLWWARKTGFFIGWHMQQIIKMGIASKLTETGLAYCDSDIFFVKPFNTNQLSQDGKIRMKRSAEVYTLATTPNAKYTIPGMQILGIPIDNTATHNTYIDNFITWHRPTVLALRDYIEKVTKRDWYTELGARLDVSEYTLYGLFVDEIQKNNPHHYIDTNFLCKTQWMRQAKTEAEVEAFCQSLEPQQVAIGVQSFAGVNLDHLKKQLALAISQYKQP